MPGATNAMHSKALSGSEKYEVGNAAMEYDAALDAMTIDADHENALGMEGVDMYANKLAALSGMADQLSADVDGDGVIDGIDIDGDGVIDVSASKPGAMMKFSEFKPPGLDVKTGMSMFQDPKCELTDYQAETNGIIPGYAGHIPRARDKYGGAAVGGCSPAVLPGGINQHIGPQGGHDKKGCLGNGFGNDGFPLKGYDVKPVFEEYAAKHGGIMPGYGGFKPGARDECGYATYGGINRFGASRNRAQPTEAQTAATHAKPGFVGKAGGVVPGYKGYVSKAKETYGISHYGSIDKRAMAQAGHGAATKGDKSIPVAKDFKAGYSGHVPEARDTFGGAHYGVLCHKSPDDYDLENKLAGTGTKMSDFRLITGSDAGNSDYASDGGGGFFGAGNHLAEFHNYATDDEPPPSQVAGRNLQSQISLMKATN